MNDKNYLYINVPFIVQEDSFTYNKELTSDEYVKMLREYSNSLNSNKNFDNKHFNSYEFDYDEEKNNFVKAPVIIYDINGDKANINELYRIIKTGISILIIEIPYYEIENLDEIFESEFKMWKKESLNIQSNMDLDENQKIKLLPEKTLRLEMDDHLFELYNCKLYCEYDNFKVALIIEKVEEI